ncbi:Protein NEOXANTHIN-DEFICIENT 1 [Picochlorum sp. SENEW3]|nr:Protein NEOXANTHIN-DEFICIENT 1 [Picochlorum sp. SENEW3]WPT15713.1 Protein NEOXANTHIN-DEFICIENT 1 [Picochlorum sp. SENEW3]
MGYSDPPWVFTGDALYQLSLVRVEEARKYVPPNIPLVNFLGYTLGGFYLARYSDSPTGTFDELVALAGLAWNFPTSCAWAARVYVNNAEARNHGIGVVGLPSRLASFKAVRKPSCCKGKIQHSSKSSSRIDSGSDWWSSAGGRRDTKNQGGAEWVEIRNREARRIPILQRITSGLKRVCGIQSNAYITKGLKEPVCAIQIPRLQPQWGPVIQLSLPSYSGGTPACPDLLKYSLRMLTKIRFIKPLKIRMEDEKSGSNSLEALGTVLGGKPLLCMSFEKMNIQVEAPEYLEIK